MLGAIALVTALVGAGGSGPGPSTGVLLSAQRTSTCVTSMVGPPIVALTRAGVLAVVTPMTLRQTATIATDVAADGALAVVPGSRVVLLTRRGPGGQSAVFSVAVGGCRHTPHLVVAHAELPSVSPDGRFVGWVALDAEGRQRAVAIAALAPDAMPEGQVHLYRATSLPPPLPIRALAIAPDDATLAVWGGFRTGCPAQRRPTTGTLDPAKARTLGALVKRCEPIAPSVLPFGAASTRPPTAKTFSPGWTSAPLYLANGEFIEAGDTGTPEMPFTNQVGSGGGVRYLGPFGAQHRPEIVSMAAGSDDSVAWVTQTGTLELEPKAFDFPFGPATKGDIVSPGPLRTAHTLPLLAWVGWTAETSPQATTAPPRFHFVSRLPNVVGLTDADAAALLNGDGIPFFVTHYTLKPGAVPGTVLTETPPAGYGIACTCALKLTEERT